MARPRAASPCIYSFTSTILGLKSSSLFAPNNLIAKSISPSNTTPISQNSQLTMLRRVSLTSNSMFDPLDSRHALGKQESSSHADSIRTETQRLHHLGPS